MLVTLLKSKIHRLTVTETNINYTGSITIDSKLLKKANILPFEQVHVVNVTNGQRLITYVIEGNPGSGEVCLNGAAARLAEPGDIVIVISYGQYNEKEIKTYKPKVIQVDSNNKQKNK